MLLEVFCLVTYFGVGEGEGGGIKPAQDRIYLG